VLIANSAPLVLSRFAARGTAEAVELAYNFIGVNPVAAMFNTP
jgi:hypothetical protein